MNSLKNTLQYPEYTKDSIKEAYQSDLGHSKIYCVVEAEDDIDVYGSFVADNVTVLPSSIGGKKSWHNVESIVSDLNSEFTDINLFGIRDADYTRYTYYVCPDNIFLTDERDLEMMLLHSSSVSMSLPNLMFSKKINDAEETTRFLGYLRIYNEVRQACCVFKKNVANTTLIWDRNAQCVLVDYPDKLFYAFKSYCDNNPECTISVSRNDFDCFVEELNLSLEPSHNICRGHDVVKLLSCMLAGTQYGDRKLLQQHIIQAYTYTDFTNTNLYHNIFNWATRKGVTVFKVLE